jgi:enoyl-CoA hydratase
MPSSPYITAESHGAVRLIWLDRVAKRNALTTSMMWRLGDHVREAIRDETVRVVVIGGRGPHFCSGGDMDEMRRHDALSSDDVMSAWESTLELIERAPKPVIAMVHGAAFGGGTELAMACHMRLAAQTARFAQTEIALDHLPGGGGTQRLPRLLPLAVAYDMLLTGRALSAEEGLRLGFVNAVFPEANLVEQTLGLATQIAARSSVAIRYTMDAIRVGLLGSLETGIRLERALASLVNQSSAAKAGMQEFLEAGRRPFSEPSNES